MFFPSTTSVLWLQCAFGVGLNRFIVEAVFASKSFYVFTAILHCLFVLLFYFLNVQIRCWGNVEWAHDYDMYELRARTAAGALFVHLTSESSTVKRKLMQD